VTPEAPFVVLGGVPGAGKTTVLQRAATMRPGLRVLDSDDVRGRLRPVLGGLPYPLYRPLVHLIEYGRVAVHLLGTAAEPVVVHDPATRPWLRSLLAHAARVRGRRPVLLVIDVGAGDALDGQVRRGRQVRRRAFARHCRRAVRLRQAMVDGPALSEGWAEVRLTDRDRALGVLLALVAPGDQAATTVSSISSSDTAGATAHEPSADPVHHHEQRHECRGGEPASRRCTSARRPGACTCRTSWRSARSAAGVAHRPGLSGTAAGERST
jgi:predicted kinase